MESFQLPQERQIGGKSEPSLRRRAKFSGSLLEKQVESRFVTPSEEAIVVPSQVLLGPIALETHERVVSELTPIVSESMLKKSRKSESVFVSVYEYLLAIFASFKRKLKGSVKKRAKLTKKGEETLEQLRYLSLLCDATEYRTPDQIIAIEAAFGEAYYEIMTLSANLQKMSVSEKEHHVRNYSKQMTKLLRNSDL